MLELAYKRASECSLFETSHVSFAVAILWRLGITLSFQKVAQHKTRRCAFLRVSREEVPKNPCYVAEPAPTQRYSRRKPSYRCVSPTAKFQGADKAIWRYFDFFDFNLQEFGQLDFRLCSRINCFYSATMFARNLRPVASRFLAPRVVRFQTTEAASKSYENIIVSTPRPGVGQSTLSAELWNCHKRTDAGK